MYITMVKKELATGEPCPKCDQVEQLLRERGVWERIDEVVWAVENDPLSAGMQLSDAHGGIALAPFFIVRDENGEECVYTSALKLLKDRLTDTPPTPSSAPVNVDDIDCDAISSEYADREPIEILRWGLTHFGADCALAFSGAEDVALVDMAVRTGCPFSVFALDTGRLHPETLVFLERVRNHYGINIDVMMPDAAAVEALVQEKGLFSFYDDGHHECCGIRKVVPLRRALSTRLAWATGQRRDQSPDTRGALAVVEVDTMFSGSGTRLIKLNPLANWTSEQVWNYIRDNDVPYNELHDSGYVSIGCAPCTRARRPGEHERASRWWWEDATKRECGLHLKE